jgi:hypothetical protein
MVLACLACMGRGEPITLEALLQKGFNRREIDDNAEAAFWEATVQWCGSEDLKASVRAEIGPRP